MFDGLADSALLAEMAAAQRDERVAVARRLMAAGRLCQVRMSAVEADDRFQWCIDNWEAVAAEVGAELGISRGRASVQMNYGVELLERLPRLGAVFAPGPRGPALPRSALPALDGPSRIHPLPRPALPHSAPLGVVV
jgi:hypothetical protein